jgi:hypothetical protein
LTPGDQYTLTGRLRAPFSFWKFLQCQFQKKPNSLHTRVRPVGPIPPPPTHAANVYFGPAPASASRAPGGAPWATNTSSRRARVRWRAGSIMRFLCQFRTTRPLARISKQTRRRRQFGPSTRGGTANQTVSEFPTLCRRAPRLRYSPHA